MSREVSTGYGMGSHCLDSSLKGGNCESEQLKTCHEPFRGAERAARITPHTAKDPA